MHTPTYRYLALERRWPLVFAAGIEVDADGTLRLARVPALDDVLTDPLPPVPGLDGPVGIGVDACGNLYIADPARHSILRVDSCDGQVTPLACLSGPGSEPGQLNSPRGVIVGPHNALYVADSGNARVQVIDLFTGQLRGIWGEPADAVLSSLPGHFAEPWDLAADRHNMIYVADPGERGADGKRSGGRVQRFTPDGMVDIAFATRLRAQGPTPGAPAGIVIASLAAGDPTADRLLVLDRQPVRLLAYTLDGDFDALATARWSQTVGEEHVPTGIAHANGVLYVADAATGRVALFDDSGNFLGFATGTDSTVAGIALDCRGRLTVHPGGGTSVRRSLGLPTFAECGTFLIGPIDVPGDPTTWQRLALDCDALSDGAHLRIFTLTSNTLDGSAANVPLLPATCGAAVSPAPIEPDAIVPAPLDRWRAAPWDATDLLALNQPARYLWIAGTLSGDGSATAAIHQLRLSFDERGWLQFLPALYSRDEVSRTFLERALAAFEGVLSAESKVIDDLPLLFDPAAVPDEAPHATWLDWLAGWVDARPDESWNASTRRGAVAGAFKAHAWRGTRASLRKLIRMYAGATAIIEEPAAQAGLWSLGATTLGADSALSGVSPQGAVLGTTAIVEHSHLIRAEDWGEPAYADLAHHFVVRVYDAELRSDGGLAGVRTVIDREKSAHTTYDLCAIGARMRVGVQARVGIDTIVAGPPAATLLGEGWEMGTDSVLPASLAEKRVGARIGEGATVGIEATVT
jgi:phage tail-like protein